MILLSFIRFLAECSRNLCCQSLKVAAKVAESLWRFGGKVSGFPVFEAFRTSTPILEY
jgi:hypothetical protein